MKKTLLTALLIAGAVSAYSQGTTGTIQWGNLFSSSNIQTPIYNIDPSAPSNHLSGQSALGKPTGSTVYNGPLLQGTGYTFAFFAGASGAVSNNLTLLGSTTFRTSTGNALPAGLVSGGVASVPGTVGGDNAVFQIRVWNNQGGTITTWAAAEAAWLAGLTSAEVSPLVAVNGLGGTDNGGNPHVTPITSGWNSFQLTSLTTVPEPTTLTLAGLGAAALLIFRRRK